MLDRCNRTSWAAHQVRNRSLRVDNSPIRSVKSLSYGLRPVEEEEPGETGPAGGVAEDGGEHGAAEVVGAENIEADVGGRAGHRVE